MTALVPSLVVLALAIVLILPAIAGGAEIAGRHRDLVLWGLPAVLAVLAAIVRATSGPAIFTRGRAAALLPWCAGAFLLDHLYLYVGHTTGWLTFTFGDQTLNSFVGRTAIWALPASIAAGVVGWEAMLRGALLARWTEAVSIRAGVVLVGILGVALSLPAVIGQSGGADPAYLAAAVVAAAAREAGCTAIALGGGGILGAGLYRGVNLYLEAFLVNDWYSLFFPAGNYVTSDPRLYAARAATAVLAAGVAIAGARRTAR